MGFKFNGLYVGSEIVERDGKTKYYGLFSVGASAYRFSVSLEVYKQMGEHAIGDVAEVQGVSVTAFNGRVYFSGSDVVWGNA